MSRHLITREWARQKRGPTFARRRRPGRWVFLFGLALTLVFGGKVLFSGNGTSEIVTGERLDTGGGATQTPLEEVLAGKVLSIPLTDPKVLEGPLSNADEGSEADIVQNTEEVEVEAGGREAVFEPAEGVQGSGSASSAFSGGAFQHIIVAELPAPPFGYFYEGWLIRSRPFDFFSTGRLIQHADDLKWYLKFDGREDKTDFLKVVVTLERDDGNPAPADHVLEGVLR